MTKEKLPLDRSSAPKEPDNWAALYSGAEKAHDLWAVFGPVTNVVRNWKWWVAAFAFVAWWNRPDVAQAIQSLIGGGQ